MTSITLDQTLIENLIRISKNAGEAIMGVYESDFSINIKTDQSPLTKADLLSNKIICQSLKEITPEIPILSEESSDIPYQERMEWKQYWLIDPLDGTKEFIKKNGEFTTNIALIREGRPVFGIIHVPVTNHTYWGSMEFGAFELSGDSSEDIKKIVVSNTNDSKLRIVTSRSHPSGDLKSLLDRIENYKLVTTGSSLKFCLIAKGEADIYPRLGLTCEWDIAAGEIIAKSAGADVVSTKNKVIEYNSKEDYLNPFFLVSNSTENKKKILEQINL